jgi:hypothetical protein
MPGGPCTGSTPTRRKRGTSRDERKEVAAALERLAGSTVTAAGPRPALDRETEERLRALGYLN